MQPPEQAAQETMSTGARALCRRRAWLLAPLGAGGAGSPGEMRPEEQKYESPSSKSRNRTRGRHTSIDGKTHPASADPDSDDEPIITDPIRAAPRGMKMRSQ